MIRRFWPRKLRLQLTIIIVLVLVVTSLVSHLGLLKAGELYGYSLRDTMPAGAQRAIADLTDGRMPAATDFAEFQGEIGGVEQQYARGHFLMVAGILILATVLGVVVASAFTNRLTRRIENVAAAARRVAEGDLTARADIGTDAGGEVDQLVKDFNHMAATLAYYDRQVSEESAAIAHELRTPLTILRGRLQGIIDGVFTGGSEQLQALVKQVDALARLVEDLRVLTLASNNALALHRQPVALDVEIRAVVATMQPDLEAMGFTVTADLHPVTLAVDADRIRQATLALMENARRHAAAGGVLEIQLEAADRGAVIRVMDRGPGLPTEEPERIFERFWRPPGEATGAHAGRALGGNGLGLSVVKAIATGHGGRVQAENRSGGGAIFEIFLPFAPD